MMQRIGHNKKALICTISGFSAFIMLISGIVYTIIGNDMLFGKIEYHYHESKNNSNTNQRWHENQMMIQSYYYLLFGILMLYFSWKLMRITHKVFKTPIYENQYNGDNMYPTSYSNQLEQGLYRYPYYNQQQQMPFTEQFVYSVQPVQPTQPNQSTQQTQVNHLNQNNGTTMAFNPTQLNQNNGTVVAFNQNLPIL